MLPASGAPKRKTQGFLVALILSIHTTKNPAFNQFTSEPLHLRTILVQPPLFHATAISPPRGATHRRVLPGRDHGCVIQPPVSLVTPPFFGQTRWPCEAIATLIFVLRWVTAKVRCVGAHATAEAYQRAPHNNNLLTHHAAAICRVGT